MFDYNIKLVFQVRDGAIVLPIVLDGLNNVRMNIYRLTNLFLIQEEIVFLVDGRQLVVVILIILFNLLVLSKLLVVGLICPFKVVRIERLFLKYWAWSFLDSVKRVINFRVSRIPVNLLRKLHTKLLFESRFKKLLPRHSLVLLQYSIDRVFHPIFLFLEQ